MSEREIIADETVHVPQGAESGHNLGHEPDRAAVRPILIGAAIFVGLIVLGVVASTFLQTVFVERELRLGPQPNPLAASSGRRLPGGPRLQVNPWRDITAFRAAETETLTTYGWVDRAQGVVRIPIDRAMDLIAERSASGKANAKEAAR